MKKKRPRNKHARELRTPKFKMRVVKDKRYKSFIYRMREDFLNWIKKDLG